jgi:hypothetical protein
MNTFKQQRGMTAGGLLLILGLIGFFAMVTLKTVPILIEYASVKGALDSLPHEPGLGKGGKKEIIKKIESQFYIDAVEKVSPKEDITITKKDNAWIVTADYEGRATLFGNVGIWIHFLKTVEVPRK